MYNIWETWQEFIGHVDEAVDVLACTCHAAAVEKGFWEDERNKAEVIALIHSELSEALEALRNGNPASKKIPDYSQVEEELADAVIRICDWCGHDNLDLGGAIAAKLEHNRKRQKKHGKKF